MTGVECKPERARVPLASGDCVAELAPAIGGAMTRLVWRGRDILRPARSDAVSANDCACFPMAPFVNRVRAMGFTFDGRRHVLAPNVAGEPHPLHGEAWLGHWQVEECSANSAVLMFAGGGGSWPWRYCARQPVTAGADGVRIALELVNLSDLAMPASFGLHPFFPRAKGVTLRAVVSDVWRTDEQLLPVTAAPAAALVDLEAGVAPDAAPALDNCFGGWNGRLTIEQPEEALKVEMRASPAFGHLHLYTPVGAPFFCAEPASAPPDAFNLLPEAAAPRFTVVAPGSSVGGVMELEFFDA